MSRTNTVTGLDIGSSSIKLVQLRGGPERSKLAKLAMGKISPGASEEEVVEVLRQTIEEAQMKIDRLVTAIPRYMAVARLISLPSKDEKELREMVRFEAERQMPFPLDQMEVDFQIIPTEGEKSRVIIAAVQKRDIESHLSLLNQLGLNPEAIQLSSFAIFNCASYNSEIEEKKVTALLHFGTKMTEINIIRNGNLGFSQCVMEGIDGYDQALQRELGISAEEAEQLKKDVGIPETASSDTEKKMASAVETWLDHILNHVKRSFRTYQAGPDGTGVEELILSGGGANLKNLDSILQDKLRLEVRLINPLRKIRAGSSRFNLPELAPQLSLAIGLALRGNVSGEMEINLLPKSVTEKEVKRKKRRLHTFSIAVIGMVILGGLGAFIATFNAKFDRLRTLRDSIENSKPLVEEVERMNQQLEILTSRADQTGSSLEILRVLSIVSPPGVYLTNFTFQRDRSVDLTGRADSESAVYMFRSALQKCGYFDKIELRPISKERDGVSFGFNCTILGEM